MADSDDFDRALKWARGLRRNAFTGDKYWATFARHPGDTYYMYGMVQMGKSMWRPRTICPDTGFTTHERDFTTFNEAKSWLIAMILTGH